MSAAQEIIGTTVACGALLQRAAFAGSCGVSGAGADSAAAVQNTLSAVRQAAQTLMERSM